MDESRRRFLKAAGLSLIGVAGGRYVWAALEEATNAKPSRSALVAKRWALVIDTKVCKKEQGCTACIDACHRTHNVPLVGSPKEEIKWIWKEPFEHAFPSQVSEYSPDELKERKVLVLCNHCDNPPCVRVCPAKATWRREDGLVMMDMHRCIGCRYCIVACPYGARSFNWRNPRNYMKPEEIDPNYPTRSKGVAEKCTLCEERISVGLQPACVEACQKRGGAGAMTFGDIADPNSKVAELVRSMHLIRRKPSLGTRPQVYYIV